MNVSLPPEQEEWVQNKVQSGRYQSASEVVREGLRLLEEEDRILDAKREEIRKRIREGIESLDRGEGIPAEEAYDRLRKHSEAHRRKRAAA